MGEEGEKIELPLAHAKVNLALEVLGRLSNGLHCIQSIICPISLADRLELEVFEDSSVRICEVSFSTKLRAHLDAAVQMGFLEPSALASLGSSKNLAAQAIELFFEHFCAGKSFGYRLKIEKHIPFEAGMGGGSADAAAVLNGLSRWSTQDIDELQLMELAVGLGADVPAMVKQQICLVEGVGGRVVAPSITEEIRRALGEQRLIIVRPFAGVSTALAYSALKMRQFSHQEEGTLVQGASVDRLITASSERFEALSRRVFGETAASFFLNSQAKALTYPGQEGRCLSPGIAARDAGVECGGNLLGLYNDFEQVVASLQPQIAKALSSLRGKDGLGEVILSGSGSAVVGVVSPGCSGLELVAEIGKVIPQGWFIDEATLLP